MSLLLDALKRAALEKKKRDYFSTEVTLNTSDHDKTESPRNSIIQDYIGENEAYSTDAPPLEDELTNRADIEDNTDELSFSLAEVEFLDDIENTSEEQPSPDTFTIEASDEDSNLSTDANISNTDIPSNTEANYPIAAKNSVSEQSQHEITQTETNYLPLKEGTVEKSQKNTTTENAKESPEPQIINATEHEAAPQLGKQQEQSKQQQTIEAKSPLPNEKQENPKNTPYDINEGDQKQQAIASLLAARKKEAKKERLSYYSIYALLCLISVAILAGYYVKTSAIPTEANRSINELLVEQPMSSHISDLMHKSPTPEEKSTANVTTTDPGHAIQQTENIANTGTLTPVHTDKDVGVTQIAPANHIDTLKASKVEASSLSPIINEQDLAVIAAYKSIDKNKIIPIDKNLKKTKKQAKKPVSKNHVIRKIYSTSGTSSANPIFALKQEAYQYYQQGNHQKARHLYEQILAQEPKNRDALLGAAAVATKQLRPRDALYYYQTQLNQNPQDHYAQAGLLTLQSASSTDPKWVSQIDHLLKKYPDAAHLHFLKANTHALNGRWEAAQKNYFSAWNLQQKNPDYSYNLAIALDQLNQAKEALRFYLQAQTLAKTQSHNIKLYQLEKRINQLQVGVHND